MILEIVGTTLMSGLLGYTFFDKHGASDAIKIQRIAATCGLTVKEGGKQRTIHLLRKSRKAWGTEYVYRIPLGLSFADVQSKKQHMEDGLNHKRGLVDLTLDDIRTIDLRGDILGQIRKLLTGTKHRKEILMDYDGTLKIRVYKEPLPEMVHYDDKMMDQCRGWTVCVGVSREAAIFHDFEQIPHMVVAGITRYGKSVFLKNVVTTLIHTQPKAVKLTLLDLKGGLAFNRFKDAKQVETVAKDVGESLEALVAIQNEMKQRQQQFLSKGYEDVKEATMKERHFIIIDEAAQLASNGESHPVIKRLKIECEQIISEIARIGGGLGYRLIFATQYPTADTLPRQVKQNCDARLCFRLQTETASRVVLDEPGAEKLPLVKGRAIYQTDRNFLVQSPFIQNGFIETIIKPHITIKPRKEQPDASPKEEAAAGRSYTLVVEKA